MKQKDSNLALLGGGLFTAFLASLCCLGPFVLLTLGIGGAWVANLRILEDYRYLLMLFTALLLGWAYKGVFLNKETGECSAEQICARPAVKKSYKIGFWLVLLGVGLLFASPELAPFFY